MMSERCREKVIRAVTSMREAMDTDGPEQVVVFTMLASELAEVGDDDELLDLYGQLFDDLLHRINEKRKARAEAKS